MYRLSIVACTQLIHRSFLDDLNDLTLSDAWIGTSMCPYIRA